MAKCDTVGCENKVYSARNNCLDLCEACEDPPATKEGLLLLIERYANTKHKEERWVEWDQMIDCIDRLLGTGYHSPEYLQYVEDINSI